MQHLLTHPYIKLYLNEIFLQYGHAKCDDCNISQELTKIEFNDYNWGNCGTLIYNWHSCVNMQNINSFTQLKISKNDLQQFVEECSLDFGRISLPFTKENITFFIEKNNRFLWE